MIAEIIEILKNYIINISNNTSQQFLEFELPLLFNDTFSKNRLDFKSFFQQDNTHIIYN